MEDNTTVLLDLDFNGLISSLQHLTKLYEANTKKLEEMASAGKKGSKEFIELQQTQKVLRQEISGVEKQIQSEIKMQKANEGSLVAMRAELQRLNKQYDSMSGFERMSEQGTALQQKIKALNTEIQGLEANTGRWQRNVGNYKSALGDLKNGFEAAGLGTSGLNSAMKLLNANPVVTTLGILGTLLVKLSTRLKSTEGVTQSLTNAMGALHPVLDAVGKAVDWLADIFSNVLDWAIEKTIDALGWLGRQIQKIGNLFGKDWGSGLVDFSDKMRAARNETENTTETIEEQTTAINANVKAMREALETIKAYAYDQALEEAAKKNKALADSLQKVVDRVGLLQEQFDKLDPHALDGMFGEVTDDNLVDTTTKWELFAESFKANAKDIEATASSLSSSFGSLSSMYQQMAKDETKTEAERAKAAKQAKTWAGLQIAANSGTALAKGIEGAMSAPTVPAKIASLAAIMAAVLSAVAQAKALAQQTYETGGVIGGYHGASMGHDNTAISARRGEMVINADQQKRLFDIANGSATSSLTASLVTALQSMPAPVLVYSELQEFGNSVNIMDTNAKLK